MNATKKKMSTETLALGAILTAMVILMQFLGSFLRFGLFSISLVLIPIVVGAVIGGKTMGAWLGFVFGVVVLASGDAAAFLAVNVPGTFITVLLKGTVCGFAAGFVYKVVSRIDNYLAVLVAAMVCPIVNTGIFAIGCRLFFWNTVSEWAGGADATLFLFTGLIGWNFVIEFATNFALNPVIVKIINFAKNKK